MDKFLSVPRQNSLVSLPTFSCMPSSDEVLGSCSTVFVLASDRSSSGMFPVTTLLLQIHLNKLNPLSFGVNRPSLWIYTFSYAVAINFVESSMQKFFLIPLAATR